MSKKQTNKIYKSTKNPNIPSGKDFLIANNSPNDFSAIKSLTLYHYVYTSTVSMISVFLLLSSLLLQGIHVAYASELDVDSSVLEVDESSVSVVENEQVASTEELVISEPIIVPEPVMSDENLSTLTTKASNTEVSDLEIISVNTIDDSVATTSGSTTTIEAIQNVASSSESLISEISKIVDTKISIVEEFDIDVENFPNDSVVSTSSDVTASDSDATVSDEATTSDSIATLGEVVDGNMASGTFATTTYESVSVTQSDTAFTFNKNECTQLTNGSFYCYQPDENILSDALFAAPDGDGDLEIFLVRNGQQAQITHNLVDDASPYYDQRSNTIVWHRSIDDRYQIVSYDLKTSEETQLTHDSVNNMEPTRQGNYTVWQRWLGNSWNIVLYDGSSETEVTNDTDHNIAPHIQGSLVIWNKNNQSGEKTIEMYNIDSGTYVTVNDPDGLSVDNPRMVLIYDSLHPNGDITTKGFNILTGEFIELDTLPKDLPEIPDSETTTEIRALIHAKPEIKAVFEAKLLNGGMPIGNGDSATTTEQIALESTLTLDLSISSSTSTETSTIINDTVNDMPDLVIPPLANKIIESTSTINVQ